MIYGRLVQGNFIPQGGLNYPPLNTEDSIQIYGQTDGFETKSMWELTLQPSNIGYLNIYILGINANKTSGYGSNLFAVFKNGLTQIGTTDKVEKSDFSNATSNISTSSNKISISVTGEVGESINWNIFYIYKTT